MTLSYREKSILGSLIAMLAVYGYYFATLPGLNTRRYFDAASTTRLIAMVVAMVVIEIVYHIVIAASSRVEAKDERDVLIETRAYRVGYFLLAGGVSILMGLMILSNPETLGISQFSMGNFLLLSMVVAETAKFLTQLFYYRKGI
jgi:hypothetical protein